MTHRSLRLRRYALPQMAEAAMALTGTNEEPIRARKAFGYAIKMKAGDEVVSVVITDDALDNMAYPPDHSPEALSKHRSDIERIASAKHSAGLVEGDGSVWVKSTDV
jgi:hypothetical protein